MFTLAVRAGKLHGKPHIPTLQEDNVRRGFFEREQFESERANLPAPLRPLVRLDRTTKNRDDRTFPFTAELERLLKDQLAEHDRLKNAARVVPLASREERDADEQHRRVFHRNGKPIKDFRGAFKSACEKAKCAGRILHDFRRTAVRNLERDGVSRSAAMAMVGHKTESIYRRYAIVDAGALRDAAAKIDRAAGRPSGNTSDETAAAS